MSSLRGMERPAEAGWRLAPLLALRALDEARARAAVCGVAARVNRAAGRAGILERAVEPRAGAEDRGRTRSVAELSAAALHGGWQREELARARAEQREARAELERACRAHARALGRLEAVQDAGRRWIAGHRRAAEAGGEQEAADLHAARRVRRQGRS